jgi:phage shock protein PspC (stress-responsive transcriptional regulator)
MDVDEPSGMQVGAPVPPRWTRRATGRWVAGVAGGLADRAAVPVWVVRVAFVVATAFGGLGLLGYLFLWWLMPRRDLPVSAAERTAERFPEAPTWLGVVLLVLGVMLFAGQLGWWRPSLLWALVLIGAGIVLFRREEEPAIGRPRPDRPAVPAAAGGDATFAPSPVEQGPDARERSRPRIPRERSFLGVLTLGVALAAWGGLAILDSLDAVSLATGRGLSLALLILGGGLAFGAFIGRARWLILPALLLTPVAVLATVVNLDLHEGFGERRIVVDRAEELPATYRLAGGTLAIDLTQLPADTTNPDVTAELGLGTLEIYVRTTATVHVTGDIGVGTFKELQAERHPEYTVLRNERYAAGGVDVQLDRTLDGTATGPRIELHVHTSIGEIQVIRESGAVHG